MAKEWYLIGNPQIYNGGYEGEEWHNFAQDGFQEILDTTMLCDDVEFINSDFSVVVPGKAIIQSVTPDTHLKAEDRQILVPIGTLQPYSYVRHEGEVWLIASEPYNNKFYEKATLKICRNALRWQNPKTKEIFSYYYWSEDVTRYSSGVFNSRILTTYDKQYSLMLPMDKNTQKLHDGMRFMLELSDETPLVYKLTKYNGITGNNKNIKILYVVLTQTVYDPDRDSVELMIADYNTTQEDSKHEDLTDEVYNAKIEYKSDTITVSSFGKFTAKFYDDELKDLEEPPEYEWLLTNYDFDDSNLVCSYQDNMIKIAVKNNRELIGKTFDLNIVLPDTEEVLATLNITITALW